MTKKIESRTLLSDIENHQVLPEEIQTLLESDDIPQNNITEASSAELFMVLKDYPTATNQIQEVTSHTYSSIRNKLINTLNAFGCGELHEYDNTIFSFDDCYLAPWSSSCPHQTERVARNVDEWNSLERRSVRDMTKGLELFTQITGQKESQQELAKIVQEMDTFYDNIAEPLDLTGGKLGRAEYDNPSKKTIYFEGKACSTCELDSCIKQKQMTTIKEETQKLTIRVIRIVEQLGQLEEMTENEMFEEAERNFEIYRKQMQKHGITLLKNGESGPFRDDLIIPDQPFPGT